MDFIGARIFLIWASVQVLVISPGWADQTLCGREDGSSKMGLNLDLELGKALGSHIASKAAEPAVQPSPVSSPSASTCSYVLRLALPLRFKHGNWGDEGSDSLRALRSVSDHFDHHFARELGYRDGEEAMLRPQCLQMQGQSREACLKKEREADARVFESLQKASWEELKNAEEFRSALTESEAFGATLFEKVILVGNLSPVRDYSPLMSTRERILFEQMFLGALRQRYNQSLADQGLTFRSVSEKEMFESLRSRYLHGAEPWKSGATCRSIVSLGGRSLQLMNFRTVLAVAYGTTETPHVTLFGGDPDRQDAYTKFNYEVVGRVFQKEGAELFSQDYDPDLPDTTLVYLLNLPFGRSVGSVPSYTGMSLAEGSGFDPKDQEPLASVNSSLILGRLGRPGNSTQQAFAGSDPSGRWHIGISRTDQFGKKTSLTSEKTGLALAIFSWDQRLIPILYGHFQQKLKNPELRALDDRLRASVDADLNLMLSYSVDMVESEPAAGLGWGNALNLGAQVDIGAPTDRVRAKLRAQAQGQLGMRDISNLSPGFFLNHELVEVEGRLRLTESLEPISELIASTLVIWDYFGARTRAKLEYQNAEFSAKIEGVGRVHKDTPTIKDGSLRRLRAGASYRASPLLQLRIEGDMLLEPISKDETGEAQNPRFRGFGIVEGDF